MKTSAITTLLILAPAALLFSACSENATEPTAGPPGVDSNAVSIDAYFDSLPVYNLDVPSTPSDQSLAPTYAVLNENGWHLDYRCDAMQRHIVETVDEIMSPDQNFGVLWPGALVQGSSIESGQLKSVPLDRAPMTLTISVDAPVTSVVVDTPNSVTVQQAVADLKRSVDGELNGESAPSHPGTVQFKVEASNSLQQSMLSMGITAGYSQPMTGEIGGSAGMELSRSYREQTVVARLVQKLFTIRIADDLPELRDPSGFFADYVDADSLAKQESDGNIGPDNLPMYVESVSYGRIIVFTLTSYTASSAQDLELAVNAAYQQYEGSGNISAEQQEMLDSRTVEVYQAGGSPAAAQAAVSSLDFSQFFTEMEATEAVPLSFQVKTVKGGATSDYVEIADSASFNERSDCTRPSGYWVDVELTSVTHTDGFCTSCAWHGAVAATKQTLPNYNLGAGVFTGQPPNSASGMSKRLTFDEPERDDIIKSWFSFTSDLGAISDVTAKYEYPFNGIGRTETVTITRTVNAVSTARFEYEMTKTPIY